MSEESPKEELEHQARLHFGYSPEKWASLNRQERRAAMRTMANQERKKETRRD